MEARNAITAIIRRELAEARKKAEAVARVKRAAEEERKRKLAEESKLEKLKQQTDQQSTAANNNTKPPSKTAAPLDNEPNLGVVTGRPKTGRAYSELENTNEERSQSINFETGRGSLPWPVSSGVATIHFGTYTIPGTQLKGQSEGVYISVPIGANVRAVADGDVSSVLDLGGEQAVTIRHGKYFTTYAHLSSTNVVAKQHIIPSTVLGQAAANDSGEGEVLFMVTNEKGVFLNPEQWLKRK